VKAVRKEKPEINYKPDCTTSCSLKIWARIGFDQDSL
jgi:hypothetical protein